MELQTINMVPDLSNKTFTLNQTETNSILKKLIVLLKPLTMVTGGGRNNLAVDIASGTVTTVATVTTVTSVTAVQNQVNMGTVNAFVMAKDQARNNYSNSVRANITF